MTENVIDFERHIFIRGLIFTMISTIGPFCWEALDDGHIFCIPSLMLQKHLMAFIFHIHLINYDFLKKNGCSCDKTEI